jgi:hypothetical protein
MKSWAKWTARTVLVTTGLAAAGGGLTGVALAGTGGTNTGNASVLSGNQVNVPVSIPIDVCGNAAAILGIAMAGCQGGASVAGISGGSGGSGATDSGMPGLTAGNIAVAHGTVVKVPVEIAADACGNSIGNAHAHCHGGVILPVIGSGGQGSGSGGSNPQQAGLEAGNLSVGSGNDVQIPVSAPINACGNAAAILGDSSAGCVGGATVGGGAGHMQKGAKAAKGGALHPTATQLASIGALPGVSSLPALGGLAGLPLLTGLTGTTNGGALLPASTLSALQANASGSGMSSNSFATLAIGALLAGAAALKIASRRPRARNASAGQGAA